MYTALFLGIVLWKIRGQSVRLPLLGPVAWSVVIVLVASIVLACIYLPDWPVLPSIMLLLTPLYLFAKLLEKGRAKLESGEVWQASLIDVLPLGAVAEDGFEYLENVLLPTLRIEIE